MKRKAIIRARNKSPLKRAPRIDEVKTEVTQLEPWNPDLNLFEALPLEIQHVILLENISTTSTEGIRGIIKLQQVCINFKKIIESKCSEDFYWGKLYLQKFGDLNKRKANSAKEKVRKTINEFLINFSRAPLEECKY